MRVLHDPWSWQWVATGTRLHLLPARPGTTDPERWTVATTTTTTDARRYLVACGVTVAARSARLAWPGVRPDIPACRTCWRLSMAHAANVAHTPDRTDRGRT